MDKIIDINLALEQAAGNEQLAKELFQMLLAELPVSYTSLKTALAEVDKQSLWDYAHKIYGATAYCGVPALRNVAQQLESFIKADDIDSVTAHTNLLAREIDRLLELGPDLLEQNWLADSV